MSETRDDGGQAFPRAGALGDGWEGMSLRDYFAAVALGAAAPSFGAHWSTGVAAGYAQRAYELADAMLKERAKP